MLVAKFVEWLFRLYLASFACSVSVSMEYISFVTMVWPTFEVCQTSHGQTLRSAESAEQMWVEQDSECLEQVFLQKKRKEAATHIYHFPSDPDSWTWTCLVWLFTLSKTNHRAGQRVALSFLDQMNGRKEEPAHSNQSRAKRTNFRRAILIWLI